MFNLSNQTTVPNVHYCPFQSLKHPCFLDMFFIVDYSMKSQIYSQNSFIDFKHLEYVYKTNIQWLINKDCFGTIIRSSYATSEKVLPYEFKNYLPQLSLKLLFINVTILGGKEVLSCPSNCLNMKNLRNLELPSLSLLYP